MQVNKNLGLEYNVTFRVIDEVSGRIVSEHIGHNSVTSTLISGIGHYLKGDSVLNQGFDMLKSYVPLFISLGTMGLLTQDCDDNGLPIGIGVAYKDSGGNVLSEEQRFKDYLNQTPGFGADGYNPNMNNGRSYLGLGPKFADRIAPAFNNPSDPPSLALKVPPTVNCELISDRFQREWISFRDVIPESKAEVPQTIDVIFSTMISTGALSSFREYGRDYIFITEAGLWSRPDWTDQGLNGMLAGYRIGPPNKTNWDMSVPENREILKQQILRVGINQVVQVIWKIQIGTINDFINMGATPPAPEPSTGKLYWTKW